MLVKEALGNYRRVPFPYGMFVAIAKEIAQGMQKLSHIDCSAEINIVGPVPETIPTIPLLTDDILKESNSASYSCITCTVYYKDE